MFVCMGNLHGLRSFQSDYIIAFMKALLVHGAGDKINLPTDGPISVVMATAHKVSFT